ncbi:MAG: ribose-phosphate pyrophosphokinase [Acidobacteria bacterium]|nr:ribose-phosphate pyrophosphokinase [Acidobacteriota bacterium]MCI0719687.1 ribose-phosphate pyrophosphokinase [Acidobacteriota bacterium]
MKDDLKIFTGTAHRALAEEICNSLGLPLGNSSVTRFSDGEVYFQILENVRGEDVFAIQPTCRPVDSTLVELLLMIDAFKRSSARRITAVLPYFGYARQDRKDKPRVPISAKLVANVLSTAGANRVLTMDLHVPQIQGFFDIPVDHLFAAPVLVDYFQKLNLRDLIVVSPDAGGVERARAYAKKLNTNLAIIDKRRVDANVAEIVHIVGEVEGRTVLIVDDMIDTAGTLVKSAEALLQQGAKKVYACCSHPVFSGPAVQRIRESCLEEVVVTNSIPLAKDAKKAENIRVLSVAELLGKAIRSIHEESSVSSLFI